MNKSYRILLTSFLLFLCACAGPHYEDGKSLSDVPSHVNTVKLKDVYMTAMLGGKDANGDYERDTSPSANDQEVTALAKTNIISQFMNLGYKVVEGDAPADIEAKFAIFYQPERFPLVDREFHVWARIYNSSDVPLFVVHTYDMNQGLIGVVAGSSRDGMVSDVARQAVVEAVDELRKGTFENKLAETSAGIKDKNP